MAGKKLLLSLNRFSTCFEDQVHVKQIVQSYHRWRTDRLCQFDTLHQANVSPRRSQ